MDDKVILCIDDDITTIDLVRLILRRGGYEFHGAVSANEGLTLAERLLPDVILLDVMMPDMDGWEVLRLLRENEKTQALRIVVLSAVRDRLEEFADGIVVKPFSPAELLHGVERALSA